MSNWKYPGLLLLGVGVSNIGAWVYFIALNLIVLERTGSAFAVSVLYILLPISALLTSLWSGSVVDRINQRRLLVMLDVARAALVFSLTLIDSLYILYALVFILNIGNTLFETSSLIYMTKLVPETSRQRFNALKNFIQSAGFILGPSIAGFLFLIGSPETAIVLNAGALLCSAALLSVLPDVHQATTAVTFSLRVIIADWKETLQFARTRRYITLVYAFYALMIVLMSGLDSLEASFATIVLLLDESTYGFLVSIAGIGIICGSAVNATFTHRLSLRFLIQFGALMTPIGYVIFATATSFLTATIGFFLLTFALAFANTGFMTFAQTHIPVETMGRFLSSIHVVQSAGVILLTALIGFYAETSIRLTYTVAAVSFLIVGGLIVWIVQDRTKRHYFATETDETIKLSS
ncbi:MFS transporter [Exiguobacterium acetylicum]|uniref:MFS transporter n=1 Tax=Exiguobacterium acetylicum TaxID=41170 RepID=UPI000680E0B3|nr:MFS transporter [Exiguobacterium acetylicum]KNH35672.1 permease [Exiguobacterium acetylicum]